MSLRPVIRFGGQAGRGILTESGVSVSYGTRQGARRYEKERFPPRRTQKARLESVQWKKSGPRDAGQICVYVVRFR